MAVQPQEKVFPALLLLCALTSVLVVALVGFFVFYQGYPVLAKTGFFAFIFGRQWQPSAGVFGILPMVVGTLAVTLLSLAIGVPLGLATALFLAEFAPRGIAALTRRSIELLAGIPSVVYGLFGMVTVVPLVRYIATNWFGGLLSPEMKTGYCILSAALVLAVMILPTVVAVAEDAIRSVPKEYKEGSLALGVPHWQTVVYVVLPAARSGIVAGIVLGMGRAIGETMAVLMVAGNSPLMPRSIFSPVRTMSGNIGLEMGYASGVHAQALFATGVVLFLVIMVLNACALYITGRRAVRTP